MITSLKMYKSIKVCSPILRSVCLIGLVDSEKNMFKYIDSNPI